MTGSENRGEKQPGRVPLQTGPGRDAIAKSVILCRFPAGLIQGNSWRQHTGSYPRSQCNEAKPLEPRSGGRFNGGDAGILPAVATAKYNTMARGAPHEAPHLVSDECLVSESLRVASSEIDAGHRDSPIDHSVRVVGGRCRASP